MTVTAASTRNQYVGNGVTVNFAYGFKILQASDLRVTVNGVVVSNYSVSGVRSPTGGTVTFTVAPAAGASILIRRAMAYLRGTDYQFTGDLPADTLNDDQDSPVMMIQQLADQVARAIVAPDTDAAPQLTLPEAALRANRVLAFDSSGNAIGLVGVDGSSASALSIDLSSSDTASKGAGQVGYNRALSYPHGTVGGKLKERISVFDFMTAAERADVQAGTRLVNVTAAVQAAINFAAATTDRQRDLEFPQGDYAVSSLDFSACRQVTIICRGAVFITGVAAATSHIVVMAGSNEPTAVRAMKMIGTMAIQTALSSYQTGLYGRWIVDSQLNVSVSGSYATAAVDLDVCFNNDWLWLYAVNTAVTKPVVQLGTNNNNANRMRLRIAGAGAGAGQVGLVMAGNSNSVFGDISAVTTAVNLVAARGCTFHLYTEVVGRSFACTSGLSRGITIAGGTYEVASSSAAFDFSGGGSIQGLVIAGVRFNGVSGGSLRQAINWGSSVYGATLIGHDLQNIDTEMTGTLRGGTGGLITQLVGALRFLLNGVSSWLGAWSDAATMTTIAGAGTTTPDASLGNVQWLTVTTAAAFTIGAPTNPTTWQPLTLRIRNNSGGALGAITWNAVFKMSAWVSPANGQSRSITFRYDGANWIEEVRTASDIPN